MNNKVLVKIEESIGKYVAEDVKASSEYIDDRTSELVLKEKTILKRGARINEFDVATLRANKVSEILVSDVALTGENKPETKIWKCVVEYFDEESFKAKKMKYFVIGKSPTDIEVLLTGILETKIKGAFRVISIVPFDKCKSGIIRVENDESYNGHKILVWYNVVLNLVDDEQGDAGFEYSMLVQTNDILKIREIIQGFLDKSENEFEWEISRIVDTHAVDVIQPDYIQMFSYYEL